MTPNDPHCSFCGAPRAPDTPLIAGQDGAICPQCVELAHKVASSWGRKRAIADLHRELPKPATIKTKLDDFVVGQDLAKEILSVAVYNHFKRLRLESRLDGQGEIDEEVEIDKSNILLIGPSGTGKTLIASTLAKIVGVPFVVVDATTLTQAGYVGEDVESILARLLEAAEGNIGQAEWGIVYLDEVDKLAKAGEGSARVRDVSGEGVQQALLKLVEGGEIKVPTGKGKHRDGETVTLDTRNILFIAGGAFPGLEEMVARRIAPPHTGGGFHARVVAEEDRPDPETMLLETTPDDLRLFGLIPEFIGRFPVLAILEPLDEATLVKILTEPKNALTRQYRKLFAFDGVDLGFEPEALTAIASEAISRGTGARGLRAVLEKLLRPLMFSAPDWEQKEGLGKRRCVVTAGMVRGEEAVVVEEVEVADDKERVRARG
ncbi:MAG: ATP-dependent Clp protease ATP-binding subunit ClpX [Alphaproteobacteria bacterium CG_4_10_14_0_2_um_filter_63_37]|nr:MAG: ATP-dependent protease ATP-binding subunit ClpX [Proteobacteria bacterium CG1_02_64_396]PJA25354.1 MAG: ATP-dependent Clp protease ATP-binding subunit ClpX [Alphaproteobacteria bacterium CG_4_10_14_0_2_um_filter_63_37]